MEKQVLMKESSTQNALSEELVVSKSDLQKKDEAHERRKQRSRDYYWKNRDEILAKQRERYAARDKEKHAARVRKYRQENREKTLAARREYRAKNKEKFKALDEKYRQKYREKRNARNRAYWAENRDALLAKKREYNAKTREKRKEYYEENKYRICSYYLNCYCLKSIEEIGGSCPDEVNNYMQRYSFGDCAEPFIKKILNKCGIYSSHDMYDDCYEAGMLAYLYSIHRCAAMQYTHTQAYIKKMIRVYIICAIIIYSEVKNICRINGMREIRLDAENSDYCN